MAALSVCLLALLTFGLLFPGVHAQESSSYNPYVNQAIIGPSGTTTVTPLLPLEFNGAGVAKFDVGNAGSTNMAAVPGDLMTLVITLSKGVPNNVNPLAALGGPGVQWFTWQYDPAIRTYYAVQNQTIPGNSSATVTIAYQVTANSFLAGSPTVSNGFNVNLQPPGYTNPQPTDDDAVSAYTYVEAFDYGDAPSSYGAAWHEVNVVRNPPTTGPYTSYIYMGVVVDPEVVYQASSDALGDDNNRTGGLNVDDEDGVTFPVMRRGQPAVIPVAVTLTASGQVGFLNAWIDWNGDGTFAAGEQVATNTLVAASSVVNVNVTVPANAIVSQPTFARFRLGPPGSGPTGAVAYGEVEDHRVTILTSVCWDFNSNGRIDVQDIMQVAARWNNPAAYDPTYDVAPPFGSPIDTLDITAIAAQWNAVCQ